MANFQYHPIKDVDVQVTGAGTVVTGSYNCGTNKFGKVWISVTVYDVNSPANVGEAEFFIAFHRYAGNVVLDRSVALVPLDTPGTLNGASVGVSVSGNTISTTFTGVAGRTIRVIGSFELTTIFD